MWFRNMAKRLEITVCGIGGNIPSKRISCELHNLERLSIRCEEEKISHISHECGYSEIVISRPSSSRSLSIIEDEMNA